MRYQMLPPEKSGWRRSHSSGRRTTCQSVAAGLAPSVPACPAWTATMRVVQAADGAGA
jgi:hypothetical protein